MDFFLTRGYFTCLWSISTRDLTTQWLLPVVNLFWNSKILENRLLVMITQSRFGSFYQGPSMSITDILFHRKSCSFRIGFPWNVVKQYYILFISCFFVKIIQCCFKDLCPASKVDNKVIHVISRLYSFQGFWLSFRIRYATLFATPFI